VILIFWCRVRIKALGSGLIAERFQGRQKKKKSRSLEEDDGYDIMNVLTIQLVAEEKVAPKKLKRKLQRNQQGFQSTFAALRVRMTVVKMRIGVFHTIRMRTQRCT
jgi:hypothetical protein